MYWPINDYSINSIFLDVKNIRLPITDKAQDAILQDLFMNEDAFKIVVSIVKNGLFPDEFPILIEEDNKLIVIEGNRRLAALKALDNPDRIPFFRDKIKSLSNPNIQVIRAVKAPTREDAIKLIANKHTINLRKAWQPLRQAYFYKSLIDNGMTIDKIIDEYPEHEIIKFIKMLETHHLAKSIQYESDAVTLMVHDDRKFPITNLERMYSDPYVSEYLGLSFDNNGKVLIKTKPDDFRKPYKKIVEDVALGEIDSRKYNTKEQRKEYIDSFPKEYKPAIKNTKRIIKSESFKENKVDKKLLEKNVKSNKTPKGLIPSYVPYKLENSSLRLLYNELRDIEVAEFPNATHDLLRSFLECSLIVFFKITGEYEKIQKNNSHNPKLGEMLSFIIDSKSEFIKDANVIETIKQIKTDFDKPYS
jgi:hypothetical protein